jgi:mono/diheme cytochrome c family protein
MKRALRILLIALLVIIVAIGGLLIYVKLALPKVSEAPDLKVEITPERVERGKYLAHSVAVCMDCHSQRDWMKFSGPVLENTLGAGGEIFNELIGFPGYFSAKNITPYGIGDWTDGELFRAITTGVDREGKPLFPVMPYHSYGKTDKDDIYAIIAYLRTLESVKSNIPPSKANFPMNFILHLIPEDPTFTEMPPVYDKVKVGGYLASMAACSDCHTPMEKGKPVLGKTYSGGREFPLITKGTVRSANITPDKETGIGSWSERQFIARFKSYEDSVFTPYEITANQFNTVMPWIMYAGMTEEDLSALYAYFQSLEPIRNKVERFSPMRLEGSER